MSLPKNGTERSDGSPQGPFGFAATSGYPEDGDTGLKLLGHRYVDPSTGRFLTRDPAQAGRNWYAYCENNPSKKVDPKGLWTWQAVAIIAVVSVASVLLAPETGGASLGVGYGIATGVVGGALAGAADYGYTHDPDNWDNGDLAGSMVAGGIEGGVAGGISGGLGWPPSKPAWYTIPKATSWRFTL